MNENFKSVVDYLLSPEPYWPATHQRNAIKLQRFIRAGAKSDSLRGFIQDIVDLARIRARFKPMHLYIVNMGSSGSHWIESMLGLLPGFYNGGEIYLPKAMRAHLEAVSAFDAAISLDAIYLAHVGGIREDFLTAKLSNSAHLAKHEVISSYSTMKRVVLLLRNPVDVAMSRTFRKDEYRQDVAPNSKDEEYLEMNCAFVERFIQSVDMKGFDLVVKYEDFESLPAKNLSSLAELVGIKCEKETLRRAVQAASKDSVAKAVQKGERAINNVYLGEKKDAEWARDYATKRLASVCSMLNY